VVIGAGLETELVGGTTFLTGIRELTTFAVAGTGKGFPVTCARLAADILMKGVLTY
jgi:hypothetical protein